MKGTLTARLENLTPTKRLLLEMKLKEKTNAVTRSSTISTRTDSSVAPLSFNQESLLFMESLNPNAATYNVFEAVRLKGKLDLNAVQKTLDFIAARHESLRTAFREIDGQMHQVILAPQPISIRKFDFTQTDSEETEHLVIETLTAEAHRPMNLQDGFLFEVALAELSAQEHFLLVKMHHIISDGWSISLFWREFSRLYQSFSNGETPALPALPIQFGDYAAWSREHLKKEEARQVEYWKNQLKNAPALLELPTDRARPAVQSFSGAQEISVLPAKLLNDLKKFSQNESATLYMTLLAAFNVLLARYTGHEDLVVGSPIAGRNKTETENLIGFFVNTLALRADLSGDPTFREFLRQIRNTTLEAFSHQDLPFEKIVAAVCPQRSLSYNPIFQTAFALQPNSESAMNIPNLEIQPLKLGSVTAKFDLFLSVKEATDGLVVTVEYNTDLFDVATVRRLMSHYRNLLESLITNPQKRVSELSIMSEIERRQLLVEWNTTTTEYPNECIHELFEMQAAQRPQEIAITHNGSDFTYQKVNRQANQIAHYLRKLGVAPNTPVGILMERSALMTNGILGILKSGGAYLPLDSGYPQARLKQMIEDAGAKLILTVSDKVALLSEIDAQVISLDSIESEIALENEENPLNVNQLNDTAYLIYTSGSTGQPKGTLIPHRAVNRLVFNTNYIDFAANDRVAHVSNVSFDAATFELWGALLHGARLVIIDKDVVLSPREFAAELHTQQISTMFLTTSLFNLIARDNPSAFKTLKNVLVGGEACDPTAARLVLENNPPQRLVNAYGPTESTTFAICHEIKRVAPDAQSIPIGRPISNTTVYLLDAHLNPVPVGVSGELYIGGDGLAKGYLNLPELTAEKFVLVTANKLHSLYSELDGVENKKIRLYRTGDIARYLPDGNIEYMGRRDGQIKLRGFRIELGEIEAVFNAHPAVKEAVIDIRESSGEKKISAYYVPAASAAPTIGELRDFLKDRLPDYMIPAIFFELAELPLNPNGKADRKKLQAIEEITIEIEKSLETPKDELELKLALIWQKVLNIQNIGVMDNFFDCGGHSLIAVRLFSEIEKTLDCRLPLATLFQAPTIKQLAELIRQGGWKSTWSALIPMRPDGDKPPFFCVHAVGGNILEYNELAKTLIPEQPFYGLQALGLDGKSAPLTDVEEMATAYLKEIREIQPEGPYYLGGRSFGGTVAYEMARQLVEQGEEIALLAIFDSYPKGWQKLCSEEEVATLKKEFLKLRVKRHLENWNKLSIAGKTNYFIEKISYKTRRYKNLMWRFSQKTGSEARQTVDSMIRNIEEINYLAIRKYVPKIYPGTVTFFSADEEVCPEENLTGWRRLAQGGVEVIEVPGNHQTMIKAPYVHKLARALETSINQSMTKTIGQ